jgi:short-subunit dehydrogenase
MREQGEGTIINMSSVAGRVSTPGMSAYCGSKFALEGMTDALRAEVDTYGIDVVLVEPGPVSTNFDDRASEELGEGLERSGAYDHLYEFYEEQETFGGASALAIEPERVANVVVDAACSRDPEARYPVGRVAKYTVLARFLPDRLRDAVFRFVDKLA